MAGPCSVGAVLLLTVAVGAAGYGRLRPTQNGRLFNGVYFVYEGKTTRESDLSQCASPTSVCSIVHRRFWLPELSQRLCRCQGGQCPYEYTDTTAGNNTNAMHIQINNRIQMKFCQPVNQTMRECGPHSGVAATMERVTDNSPLQGKEERDFRVNCSCKHPDRYLKKLTHTVISNPENDMKTERTTYTCQKLEACKADGICGDIRMDTYSTYHTCRCPKDHYCLFREEKRVKVKRDVEQLFYHSTAYVGECRRLRR